MPKVPANLSEDKLSPKRSVATVRHAPDINEYYRSAAVKFRAAKYMTLIALVAFLIFSFTFMRKDITLENLRYLLKFISFTNTETSITAPKINYASGDPNRLDLFVGDLVTLTNDGYALYDSRGNQIMSEDISYKSPVLKLSDRFALCYDLGGSSFSVLNTFAKLYDGTTDYPITDAAVADDGTFAVASSTREYRTLVTLYDDDFKPINRVLKNDHLMGVEMKPDGSEVAIMTSGTENGAFYTRIELIEPGKDRARRSCEIDGLGYMLYYTSDGFAVVTDEALCFLDGELNLLAASKHGSTPVMTECSSKYVIRVLSDGIIGNSYFCEIFDLSGKLVYSGGFEGKLSAIASDDSGEYIFILAGDRVIRINLYNKKIGSIAVEQDAIDILPQDADSFLLAKRNYALTYELENFDEQYYERPSA